MQGLGGCKIFFFWVGFGVGGSLIIGLSGLGFGQGPIAIVVATGESGTRIWGVGVVTGLPAFLYDMSFDVAD